MRKIKSVLDGSVKNKNNAFSKLQKAYDWAFEANTSLYVIEISHIEEDLKRMFGHRYRDIRTIFEHIEKVKHQGLSEGYFTKEDITNIKIGNFLQSLNDIVRSKDEEDAEFEEQIQEYKMYT